MKLKKPFIYGIGILCLTCFASAQDDQRKGPPEGGRPPGSGDAAAKIGEFLKRADTDSDGKISKEEFATMGKKESEERFVKMDANGDGFVDQEEIAKISQMARQGQGQGMRRPEGSPPGGGEGGVRRPPSGEGAGRPEGMRPGGEGGQRGAGMFGDPKESFKRMDTDGNGSVSEDEYIAAMTKLREAMGSRGGQPGAGGPGGMRRPGGEGGAPGEAPSGGSGFRRPPSEGDAPKPEGEKPKEGA